MLQLVSDILKADYDPHVVEDPSMLRIDHLGLCELLLDLLQWQLQAPPDSIHLMQRALMNAWRMTLERLTDAIKMTDGPATKPEAEIIGRILTSARTMVIPSDPKLNKALDILLSALGARNLGPATETVFHHWKSLTRARTSISGSMEVFPSSLQGSNVSLLRNGDDQNSVNRNLHNDAVEDTLTTEQNPGECVAQDLDVESHT